MSQAFQDRFKGKVTVMGKGGVQSIIPQDDNTKITTNITNGFNNTKQSYNVQQPQQTQQSQQNTLQSYRQTNAPIPQPQSKANLNSNNNNNPNNQQMQQQQMNKNLQIPKQDSKYRSTSSDPYKVLNPFSLEDNVPSAQVSTSQNRGKPPLKEQNDNQKYKDQNGKQQQQQQQQNVRGSPGQNISNKEQYPPMDSVDREISNQQQMNYMQQQYQIQQQMLQQQMMIQQQMMMGGLYPPQMMMPFQNPMLFNSPMNQQPAWLTPGQQQMASATTQAFNAADQKSQQGEDAKKSAENKKNYTAYTLKEYKDIQKMTNFNYAKGLGPALSEEEYTKQKEKRERALDFAQQVKHFNKHQLQGQQNTGGKPSKKEEIKEPSKREKAIEFAKNVPKPKVVVAKQEEVRSPPQQKGKYKQNNIYEEEENDYQYGESEIAKFEKLHNDFQNKIQGLQ